MAVYDCCMLYNEIDLLKIRMSLLKNVVDYFVVVELNKTFRGKDKPYFFKEREKEFIEYRDRIIYVTSENIPCSMGAGDWSIEKHQRNCMIYGLRKCFDDDIIMISDVDEIPNPDLLVNSEKYYICRETLNSKKSNKRAILLAASLLSKQEFFLLLSGALNLKTAIEKIPICLHMRNYYYYMNCQAKGFIPTTIICKYKNMQFPQTLRDSRNKLLSIKDGGWHFSYLGGMDSVKRKLKSIIDDRPEIVSKMRKFSSDDAYIQNCLENGKDLYGRTDVANTFSFISPTEIGIREIEAIVKEYPNFFSDY